MVDLSVHLITYNNEKHIEATLNSILSQNVNFTYEIVVGDDCSSDKTLKIIHSYSKKHPNLFNIIKNKTQLGILKNFKATLDRCRGKYVFDIAGDDLFNKTYALQKMYDTLESNNNLGFVDSGFDEYIENTNRVNYFKNKNFIKNDLSSYKNSILLGLFTPIGICFNREKIYKHVDFENYIKMGITIEDYPILVDLVMNSSFKTINESLHIYRVHKNSDSRKPTFEKSIQQASQMLNLFVFFKKKYNFSETLYQDFKQNHYKTNLYLAGVYEKKELGKDLYRKIIKKSLTDKIHYLASQYKIIRLLTKARKNKNIFLTKTKILFKFRKPKF